MAHGDISPGLLRIDVLLLDKSAAAGARQRYNGRIQINVAEPIRGDHRHPRAVVLARCLGLVAEHHRNVVKRDSAIRIWSIDLVKLAGSAGLQDEDRRRVGGTAGFVAEDAVLESRFRLEPFGIELNGWVRSADCAAADEIDTARDVRGKAAQREAGACCPAAAVLRLALALAELAAASALTLPR